jgi:hypothetical protein
MTRAPVVPTLAAAFFAVALLASASAGAAGVDPDAATPVQREQAQARFARGRQLFNERKFQEALGEFQGSHDIVASPNARLYMAHCYRELGKLVAAYEEFGRAATEAREHALGDPRYVKTAESSAHERDDLAPKLGFVTVTVQNATPATTLAIGGDEIKTAAWSEAAPVLPGTTDVVATTPGSAPVHVSVTVAAGEKKNVTLDAGASTPPEPPPAAPAVPLTPQDGEGGRSTMRTLAYVSGGVGVVGLATFTISGLMAKSTYDSLESQCHGPCTSNESSQVSSGETKQTIANVGLVVGAIGVAAGVTLFVISAPPGKPDAPAAAVVGGPGWLGLRGTF